MTAREELIAALMLTGPGFGRGDAKNLVDGFAEELDEQGGRGAARKVTCGVCKRRYRARDDGTIRAHNAPRSVQRCDGGPK